MLNHAPSRFQSAFKPQHFAMLEHRANDVVVSDPGLWRRGGALGGNSCLFARSSAHEGFGTDH